jgi:hypothetical protein
MIKVSILSFFSLKKEMKMNVFKLIWIQNLNSFAKPGKAEKMYKISAMSKMSVRKEPKGVVLVIGSWNYPVS